MTNYFRASYYLHDLIRRAYWPPDKLRQYQNEKLRKIVRYAYEHVPFYHNRFRKEGIKPSEIGTVADLNKLPISRKHEIRKNIDRMVSRDARAHRKNMKKPSA